LYRPDAQPSQHQGDYLSQRHWPALPSTAGIIELALEHLPFLLPRAVRQMNTDALDVFQGALDVGLACAVEAQQLLANRVAWLARRMRK
jgi:hypothetical protein